MERKRREQWCQTPATRITGPDEAARFIERVGVATLYPVSPEVPNLFHAYVGDPTAPTDAGHASPSGEVYGWRWTLGRREAAFYSVLVRGRPTWVSWAILPSVLRLCGEARTPDELFESGALSANAYRIVQTLQGATGSVSTAELRRQAGFPTGKAQRAAYLKAVDELDRRLLLAKVFVPDEATLDMHHALVRTKYASSVAAAEQMSRDGAIDTFLQAYLPAAVYVVPTLLAKHMTLPEAELRAGLDRLVHTGQVTPLELQHQKGLCYLWIAAGRSDGS